MIRVENLTKEYDLSGKRGHVLAADRLSLHIPAGEIFGLVGPNGAGKTTTLKMICGLLMPSGGRVTVNGIDVEREPEEAQKHIGYLADFFALYDDLKSWEYLDYFSRAYKMDEAVIPARITQVIGLMGLESKRDAFIHGLSRGMKQRLGIARAILHDPPVLVLDEPASGLDPKARHELKLLIKDLQRGGKTVFITSHVLSDLEEICTSIGILEKGKLVRLGPLEQILRGEGAAATGARRVRIKLAAPGFALADWLAARP
ncbi:MAG: ABC transporter ATP-binding protein, partial [Candidatus Acidiferrales bacterium]